MAGSNLPSDPEGYDAYISQMRTTEYPMLQDSVYLDHAGTTLYSKTLLSRFHDEMLAGLYGNPHSSSPSSQRSTQLVENVRLDVLRMFGADPEVFDIVFTANATAAIKLLGEALREWGFDYASHVDSHTSLVGLRELAEEHVCLETDEQVRAWLLERQNAGDSKRLPLFAYPLQSNMNGRRLPLQWCRQSSTPSRIYTLADAAAFASTSPLDLSDDVVAPDFCVLSFYKIFGFPDLGALIVKKSAVHIFSRRKYFGGGTVDMVVCLKEDWHATKHGPLHQQLEDGTLPIHSIMALKSALQTHEELFGTLHRISEHTTRLAKSLYDGLASLRHANGRRVCDLYKHSSSTYGDSESQGPIVAFNILDRQGDWVSNAELEKLTAIKNIHIRTGGVCNPGGTATALHLAPWEMRQNLSSGHRCGSENDILNGKPTGIIRVSLGAMSTSSDIQRFLTFMNEFFVEGCIEAPAVDSPLVDVASPRFHVESLTVYPIKSCGGWQIPHGQAWQIRPEGLAWDREWCIVHQGTGKALSQKQHPRMALLRPVLDLKDGLLRVSTVDASNNVTVSLSRDPDLYVSDVKSAGATICGDGIQALIYSSPTIAAFFTEAIGTPCTLARFNPASDVSRHSKAHLQPSREHEKLNKVPRPILFSNESPILTISRSSLNRLNEQIKAKGGKAALPSVFRANIVIAEDPWLAPGQEQPWAEDWWRGMRIGATQFDFLGGCRRCQMICVDQESGVRNSEPFITLAKTRRFGGRVLFGVHTALMDGSRACASIRAGDLVETLQ